LVAARDRCPECDRKWVHIRDGIYGCLYMAGHHERQIIYRIGQEPPKADVLLHVNVPPTRYKDGKSKGAKNNLKPKQKRRLMVLLAERDGGWFCWYCGNPLTEKSTILSIGVTHRGRRLTTLSPFREAAQTNCTIFGLLAISATTRKGTVDANRA